MLNAMTTGGIIALVIVGVIVLLVLILIIAGISMRNTLVRMKNNVDEGWSTIDVYLKKRYDLIPNLVETVKGYAAHERKTLDDVVKARSSAISASPQDKIEAENQLTGALRQLMMLSENYPDLKADRNFAALQEQLQRIETELAQSRKYYNATVKALNTKIELFPSNIIAGMMRLEKRKFFEVDESERKNVSVRFD